MNPFEHFGIPCNCDCGKTWNYYKWQKRDKQKENSMKELTVKEAIHAMIDGEKVDAFDGDEKRYTGQFDPGNFSIRNEHGEKVYPRDACQHKYYIHETPPQLLEGVLKGAINRANNDKQGMITHGNGKYNVICGSTTSVYNTLSDLKKEWHIVG